MRLAVALALAVTLGLAAVATQTRVPLKQDLEILTEGPMRADRVKDGLYVIRGPFLYCMRGCPPGQKGDGLVHESGDVALRVTPAGLVVVDDKFPDQAADVLAHRASRPSRSTIGRPSSSAEWKCGCCGSGGATRTATRSSTFQT